MAKQPAPASHDTDPTAGPLTRGPFPEVADALRSRVKPILQDWGKLLRQHIPPAKKVRVDQLVDGVPDILNKIADAMGSTDLAEINRLMERSPEQGVHRFEIHYDVREVATEDRMLRKLILEHVDAALGRRLDQAEAVALNWSVDLMWQQAVVAFVDHQNTQLRAAAEAELKYLSFLSHDLSGNLGSVTLWLQVLRQTLSASPKFADELSALDAAQQAILDTMGGMGRLLQAERLRHKGVEAKVAPVDLHELCATVAGPYVKQAEQKGLVLAVDVPVETRVTSDAELIRLVLQNLLGNAVKYAGRGSVRVRVERAATGCALVVADEGPGIAPDKVNHIFEAFRRGEMHGQAGVGLGLAIASRAARLLNATLTVDSTVGVGSTFRLALPENACAGA